MSNTTYNGWSNYPTWRINLEILNDIDWAEEEIEILTEEMLEDYVENAVFEQYSTMEQLNGLMEDYARAFLSEVNYREILESLKDDYKLNKE